MYLFRLLSGVPTVMGAKLNVTEILLGMYKSEHLVEVALFENGTKFAYMNTAKGAAVTGNNHPVAGFGNRLKVTDGSLIITHIMATDNGTEIQSKARLKRESQSSLARRSNLGYLRVDIIRILVNSRGNLQKAFPAKNTLKTLFIISSQ